jgi:ERCC4-type nuclease
MNNINLIIDNRETKLKELLCNNLDMINVSYENLQLGDFVFKIDDSPILFIERKTINDLASSIKDNRFLNQKNALLTNVDRKMIYYIIEGEINFKESPLMNSGISMNSLQSCILNTMIRDDIKVIITKNIDETVFLLQAIANRLVKNPDKYKCTSSTLFSEPVITKYKATMIGKDKFFENVLLQVPGISVKIAKTLINKFESLSSLYETMKEKTEEEKLNILSSITTCDKNGKNRKISSAVVKNIIEYF